MSNRKSEVCPTFFTCVWFLLSVIISKRFLRSSNLCFGYSGCLLWRCFHIFSMCHLLFHQHYQQNGILLAKGQQHWYKINSLFLFTGFCQSVITTSMLLKNLSKAFYIISNPVFSMLVFFPHFYLAQYGISSWCESCIVDFLSEKNYCISRK